MDRRTFLRAALALPGAAALGGCGRFSFEQGLMAECRTHSDLARLPLVRAAWEGIRPERVWDVHAHLFGNGRSGSGIFAAPDFDRPQSLEGHLRQAFFANGGCLGDDAERFDQAMVARIVHLADELPVGAKLILLAFDFAFDEGGKRRDDLTTFAVPDAYAKRVAAARPDRFEWTCSVHPYREDAVARLEAAKAGGARAVKWLPPSMGIDLAAPRCRPYYEALRRLDLPLLVHVGEEQAVPGAGRHELGEPLLLRHPLEQGVRVIAAHCASLGEGNFGKFARLMDERRYDGLLFGDLSAVTQVNRGAVLPAILGAAPRWEGRLLNGTDYPLPGILPLFSPRGLVSAGLLDARVVPELRQLREANALVFDFVLKRNLRHRGQRLPASVFETRGFFDRG